MLTQEITFHNSWIMYRNIEDIFGSLFESWKTKRKAFGPGFYYYLGLRRGLKLYSEHRFMNSIWGLESLHRSLHGDTKNAKMEQKVARILGRIDNQEDKKWLERQLKFCAEPSLKDRIYELFALLPLNLDEGLLKAFAEKCADYRNDLSHFGTTRKDIPNSKFIHDLHVLGSALELLYHFKILLEIGISSERIKWLVTNGFESHAMKGILWDAGLLKSDPQVEAQEAAMASIEATRKRLAGTPSANNDGSPE